MTQSHPLNLMRQPSIFYLTPQVKTTEILWTIDIVASNNSFNSNDEKVSTLQRMFPDSEIAQNMTAGRKKLSYLLNQLFYKVGLIL